MSNTFNCIFDKKTNTLTLSDKTGTITFSDLETCNCDLPFPNKLTSFLEMRTLSFKVKCINHSIGEEKEYFIKNSNFFFELFNSVVKVAHNEGYLEMFDVVKFSINPVETMKRMLHPTKEGFYAEYELKPWWYNKETLESVIDLGVIFSSDDKKDFFMYDFTSLYFKDIDKIYNEVYKLLKYVFQKHNSLIDVEFNRRNSNKKVIKNKWKNILRVDESNKKLKKRDVRFFNEGDLVAIDYLDVLKTDRCDEKIYKCKIKKIGKDYLEIVKVENKHICKKIKYKYIKDIYLDNF